MIALSTIPDWRDLAMDASEALANLQRFNHDDRSAESNGRIAKIDRAIALLEAARKMIPGAKPRPVAGGHEGLARHIKATHLANVLDAHDISAKYAARVPEGIRVELAKSIGVKRPSQATWALVVEMLADRELCHQQAK